MIKKIFTIIRNFFWLIPLGFFLIFIFIQAYAPTPTHTTLTETSVKLYNQFNQEKITDQEMEWLRQGDIEEDVSPRWLNHFYDPTTGKGWIGEGLMVDGKEMSPELVLKSQSFLIGGQGASAPDWANNQALQTYYDKYLGDQTFDRAVYEYAQGNKKDAFIALGHVFHLIQDMTVPAHTRQDTHADAVLGDGDPYESWLKENQEHSKIENFNEIIGDYSSFKCSDLRSCFEQLAQYSNQYFFSKDTINKKYEYPKILFKEGEIVGNKKIMFGYGQDEQGKNFKLVKYGAEGENLDDYLIHQAYWLRLSKKAVMGGAELLRLFKEETAKAEAIQQSGQKYAQGEPLTGKSKYNLYTGSYAFVPPGEFFSPLGEILKFKDKTDKFKNFIGGIVMKVLFPISSVTSFVQERVAIQQAQQNTISGALGLLLNRAPAEEPSAKNEETNPLPVSVPALILPLPAPVLSFIPPSPVPKIIHAPYQPLIESLPQPPSEVSQPPAEEYPTVAENEVFPLNEVSLLSGKETSLTEGNETSLAEPKSDSGGALPHWLSYGTPPPAQFTPSENEGSESEGSEVEGPDLIPPDIEVSLKDYKLTLMNFTVVWNSTSTDLAFYDVQFREENEADWSDWVSNSSSTEKSFETSKDNTLYYFRARATDLAGNQSQWQEISAEIHTKPVVINEIAWMGTGKFSQLNKDEWIELYNKSNQDISLADWNLISLDKGGPDITFASSSLIKAKSYILVERTNDETISDITADLISSFGNGLDDDGEVLELKDKEGNVIDSVGAENEEWYAGDKTSRATMERINPFLAGDNPLNWKTNDGKTINGLAADGKILINGTPGQPNSVFNPDYFIGSYAWSRPKIIAIAGSPAGVSMPVITVDSQNFPHIIYNYVRTFGISDFVYNFYNGAKWLAEPKYVTSDKLRGHASVPPPNIVKNPVGSAQFSAIFSAVSVYPSSAVYFSQLDEDKWSKPVTISDFSTNSYYCASVADNQDRVHVVWETLSPNNQIYYRALNLSSDWSEIIRVSSSTEAVFSPAIAVDNNDQPHLVWFEYTKSLQGIGIYYSTIIDNQWTEPKKIFDYKGLGITHPDSPSLAIDENNILHLLWSDKKESKSNGDIYYSQFSNGIWSEPINLSNTLNTLSRLPYVVSDNQNKIHAVWVETVGNKEQIFYSRFENDSWTEPINVWSDDSKNFSVPKLAVDNNDQLHLVWSSWGSDPKGIYYSAAKP